MQTLFFSLQVYSIHTHTHTRTHTHTHTHTLTTAMKTKLLQIVVINIILGQNMQDCNLNYEVKPYTGWGPIFTSKVPLPHTQQLNNTITSQYNNIAFFCQVSFSIIIY